MSEIAKTPSKVWQKATANAPFRAVVVSLCFCFLVLVSPVRAQDVEPDAAGQFIDGFPDVPVLSSVSSLLADPVVFDTPSGTVAEATLALSQSFEKVLDQYNTALTALGWRCAAANAGLRCKRDDSQLAVSRGLAAGGTATLLLRLEPS